MWSPRRAPPTPPCGSCIWVAHTSDTKTVLLPGGGGDAAGRRGAVGDSGGLDSRRARLQGAQPEVIRAI